MALVVVLSRKNAYRTNWLLIQSICANTKPASRYVVIAVTVVPLAPAPRYPLVIAGAINIVCMGRSGGSILIQ
jgi:hypothetical protein